MRVVIKDEIGLDWRHERLHVAIVSAVKAAIETADYVRLDYINQTAKCVLLYRSVTTFLTATYAESVAYSFSDLPLCKLPQCVEIIFNAHNHSNK